jgi:hypothetical protein
MLTCISNKRHMVLFYVVLIVLFSIWFQLQVLIRKYKHTRLLHLIM